MPSGEKPKENRLKDRYRLIIYNDNTLKEVGFLRLTGFNLLWIVSLLAIVGVGIVFVLIAYTSIRELIPGYPDSNFRRTMVENAIRLDSLQNEIRLWEQYYTTLNRIISGQDTSDTTQEKPLPVKTSGKTVSFTRSPQDSLLRQQIEREERFNITGANLAAPKLQSVFLGHTLFFPPVKGVISQKYSPKHYGVDLVSKPNEVVKSVLDGTVIFSAWTIETGYTIAVQHENNFVSIYKHNSDLLKKTGTFVRAGEAIAIIGNTGELSSGPHLHFELWYNGSPVNPEDYIVF
mgnify:CR=1 FL=1